MSEFLLCIVQYLLILIVLAGVAAAGIAIGIHLSKKKTAKQNAQTSEHSEEA